MGREQQQPKQKNDGVVRVGRETKGRKGKGVSLITGVPLPAAELKKLISAKDVVIRLSPMKQDGHLSIAPKNAEGRPRG